MSIQRNKAFLSLFQSGAEHRDAALAYASYQLFVHPLAPKSKEPVLKQWQRKATTNFSQIREWWPAGSKRNIGIYLKPSCIVVIDVDPRNNGDETFELLCNDHGLLPTTYTVKTAGDGRHYYFRVPVDFYDSEIAYPTKLGDGVEFLVNKYVVAPPSELKDGRQYTVTTGDVEHDFAPLPFSWLDEVVRSRLLIQKEVWHDDRPDWTFGKGERNDGATKVAGYLRRAWFSEEEIAKTLHLLGETGRFDNYDSDAEFQQELDVVANSVARKAGEIRFADISIQIRQKTYKPTLDIEGPAFHGPLGEFVKYIEPITEAHPAALLGQSLAVFGNLIGAREPNDPGPGFNVEDGHHKTSLYVMIVGESAQAAKGDSWSRVRNFFKNIDPTWRPKTGIQTGEAIINQLADDEETEEIAIIQGVPTKATRKGSSDKRFLVFEPEFVRVLHVAQRQGSIVKDILRAMWDTGETESIAKASQQRVTNGTLSIVGHITKADLERELADVDLINGFGNRFLYIHSERTQFLASAPAIPKEDLHDLLLPFHEALDFAQTAPIDYPFTKEAWALWVKLGREWHNKALKPMPSIEDQLAGRARASVRRMAVIYAVADCSDIIQVAHLEAANAFWEYCFDSVLYIFGTRIGDPDATKLYRALIEFPPGLTVTEINKNVFKGNKSKAQIARAITLLLDKGVIKTAKMKMGRKTVDRFFIVQHQAYEGEK